MPRRKAPRNFRSKEAYHKWLAYGHIHGKFKESPGNTPVRIRGKRHRVRHG